VVYADDALDDLDRIADYYMDAEAYQAAIDVPERIRESCKLLGHTPQGWQVGVSGKRERVLQDLPFRIVYDENGARVLVLRVKHTRQQWP
jgi:plasmid stabilization system protein ParE